MNRTTSVSSEVADLICAGNKLGAVAALRKELNCSLREAKSIVDEFDQHLGAKNTAVHLPQTTEASKKPAGVLSCFIFLLITGRHPLRFLRSLRYARKHAIDIDFNTLRTHALVGNSLILVHGLRYARTKGIPHTAMMVAAGQLTFGSSQRLHEWIDQGLPDLRGTTAG